MRIAIAADDPDENASISLRAGRAPYYLIFEDGQLAESIKNPFAVGGGGAGWSVAYMLAQKNIDLVIAGKIGGNFMTALTEKNIPYKEEYDKSAKEVVNAI